jgi:hypothetical protein
MGSLNDSYRGSSKRLLHAMKKRPLDFRRKILWVLTVNDRKLLLAEEERWLQMIKPQHLQIRYYNIQRRAAGGFVTEGYTSEQRQAYLEKLRNRPGQGKNHYAARTCFCIDRIYDTLTDAKEVLGWDPTRRIKSRKHVDFYFIDEGRPSFEEVTDNIAKSKANKKRSIEAMSKVNKALPKSYHKARTQKSGLVRRGQHWRKPIEQRKGTQVSIDGVIYANLKHAQASLGLSAYIIRKRCQNDSYPNYFFI